MKKKMVGVMLTAMCLTASVSVFAAPSIGQIIPEAPVVVSGTLESYQRLIVQDADTDAYSNSLVAEAVLDANDETKVTTVVETLEKLGVEDLTTLTTTDNEPVDPAEYEYLTPFVDLALDTNGVISYEIEGDVTANINFEAAKETEKEDLMLMMIDPDTAETFFIAVDELDENGWLTATYPTLGPFALLTK